MAAALIAALHVCVVAGDPAVAFTNFADATQVMGQTNFTNQDTAASATVHPGANSVALSPWGHVAVGSQQSQRVLIWNALPSGNGAAADVVVGKPDFTSLTGGVTASVMGSCDGVAFSPDGKFLASDSGNNRVLIWNSIPTVNGQPADVVIGQTDFTSNSGGTSATKFSYPTNLLVTPDGKLLVADWFNHRVLIFNTIPTSNGAAADVVIGQSSFTTNGSGSGASQLNRPWSLALAADGRLLVAETHNNRVVIFGSIPVANGAAASVVIGQAGFGASSPGASATTMDSPIGVAVSPTGELAVGEFFNHRVLLFNDIPTSNGAAADVVLGQPDFVSNTEFNGGVSARSMRYVYQVVFTPSGRLLVSGRDMHRVMVFTPPCDGDGLIDAGEQCDDDDLDDGDGCSHLCRIEICWTCTGAPSSCSPSAGGSPCPGDGNVCTSDVCNGAGLCIHPGDVDAGTPCPDDGSVCTSDACDGAGTCAHTQLPDGSPCPADNSLCTGDVCNAGTCTHPSIVDCSLVNQCHEPGSCDPSTGTCTYCPAGYTAGGGGCRRAYPIDLSLLDNLVTECSGPDDLYNGCNGAFGFHWTDTGDGSVGAVVSVDLLINAGVDCSGTSRAVSLNGDSVGSYATTDCACFATPEPRLLSAIDFSSYVKGAANAVLIDDPFNACVGLRADGNSNFAVVTVAYAPPAAPLLPDGSSCTDFLYCTGTDTCSSGNCDQHAGDPCIGGGECNATCNEAADNCYDLPPTPCTADSNPCTVDQCNGAGACAHPAGNAGAECRPDGGQCDVPEQCDGASPTCPADGFSPDGTPCDDSDVCTQTDLCNGSNVCVGSNEMDCSDGDVCTADLCDPTDGCDNPSALALDCKTAPKAILILKQNGGAGDKQLFKWAKGEALDQASELGDPTGTTEYGICIYSGPSNELLESFSVPAAGNWDPIGTKGYKYKDANGAASGLTNVLLKGGAAGKTKVLVKGKGGNLPDPTLSNLPLPVTAQVINPDTGVCIEAVFDTGDVKKNTDTLFKAKAQ